MNSPISYQERWAIAEARAAFCCWLSSRANGPASDATLRRVSNWLVVYSLKPEGVTP